ncbi:MAG: YceI family protein [Chloroflexota bacterium]|nr:YceI family protein [Chloroflexota bacterium]
MRRILLALGALIILGVLGVVLYTLRLTANVEVATTPPTVATLVPEVESTPRQAATDVPPASAPTTTGAPTATAIASGTAPVATLAPEKPTARPARVFRIDPKRSRATYKATEIFLENNRSESPVGVTQAVSGEIRVNPDNPAATRVGEIAVDISQLTTGESRRDNAIRRQWLESATYPIARFRNATLTELPTRVEEGKPFTFKMTGDMTIREATRKQTWSVTATLSGDTLQGKASTGIKMIQYGVDPPNIPGFVRVEDEVALTLEFVATAIP